MNIEKVNRCTSLYFTFIFYFSNIVNRPLNILLVLFYFLFVWPNKKKIIATMYQLSFDFLLRAKNILNLLFINIKME
jgi:hypothetical protein